MNYNELKSKISKVLQATPLSISDPIAALISIRNDCQDTYLKLDQALNGLSNLYVFSSQHFTAGGSVILSEEQASEWYDCYVDLKDSLSGLMDQNTVTLVLGDSPITIYFYEGASYGSYRDFSIETHKQGGGVAVLFGVDKLLAPMATRIVGYANPDALFNFADEPVHLENIITWMQQSRTLQQGLFEVVNGVLNGNVNSIADVKALLPGDSDPILEQLRMSLMATNAKINIRTLLVSLSSIYEDMDTATGENGFITFNSYTIITQPLFSTICTELVSSLAQLVASILAFIHPIVGVISYAVSNVAALITQGLMRIKQADTSSSFNFDSSTGILGIPILQSIFEVPGDYEDSAYTETFFPWGLENDYSCILVVSPGLKTMIWRIHRHLYFESYIDLTSAVDSFYLTLKQELLADGWDIVAYSEEHLNTIIYDNHDFVLNASRISNIYSSYHSAMQYGLYPNGCSEYAAMSEDERAIIIYKALCVVLFSCCVLKNWTVTTPDVTFHLPSRSKINNGDMLSNTLGDAVGSWNTILDLWLPYHRSPANPVTFSNLSPEELFTTIFAIILGVESGRILTSSSYYWVCQWRGCTQFIYDWIGYQSPHRHEAQNPAMVYAPRLAAGLPCIYMFPSYHTEQYGVTAVVPGRRGFEYMLQRSDYFTLPPSVSEANYDSTIAALAIAGATTIAVSVAGFFIYKRATKRLATKLQKQVLDARNKYNTTNVTDSAQLAEAYSDYNKKYWAYSFFSGITGTKGLATSGGVEPYSFGTGNGSQVLSFLNSNATRDIIDYSSDHVASNDDVLLLEEKLDGLTDKVDRVQNQISGK